MYKRDIGLMNRVFTNGPGDLKMVLDSALFNTQHYKLKIKGKVQQSRELSRYLPYTSRW